MHYDFLQLLSRHTSSENIRIQSDYFNQEMNPVSSNLYTRIRSNCYLPLPEKKLSVCCTEVCNKIFQL